MEQSEHNKEDSDCSKEDSEHMKEDSDCSKEDSDGNKEESEDSNNIEDFITRNKDPIPKSIETCLNTCKFIINIQNDFKERANKVTTYHEYKLINHKHAALSFLIIWMICMMKIFTNLNLVGDLIKLTDIIPFLFIMGIPTIIIEGQYTNLVDIEHRLDQVTNQANVSVDNIKHLVNVLEFCIKNIDIEKLNSNEVNEVNETLTNSNSYDSDFMKVQVGDNVIKA